MCSRYSPTVEDTMCVTKNIVTLFIKWLQICASSTEWGIIVFVDCSQSQLTSLGIGCHKWLNCLLFGYWKRSLYCTKYSVFTARWQKTIIWDPFYGFKSKRLFRMNLMHGNTDNISHVPILTWPGMTSSLTSHGSVNDITQKIFLNSSLVLSFYTNKFHLKRWLKVLRANQCYENLPFISINVSFRKAVSLITFP